MPVHTTLASGYLLSCSELSGTHRDSQIIHTYLLNDRWTCLFFKYISFILATIYYTLAYAGQNTSGTYLSSVGTSTHLMLVSVRKKIQQSGRLGAYDRKGDTTLDMATRESFIEIILSRSQKYLPRQVFRTFLERGRLSTCEEFWKPVRWEQTERTWGRGGHQGATDHTGWQGHNKIKRPERNETS